MSERRKAAKDLQYIDLMPVVDNDNRGEYVNILKDGISNKSVKNIALSGPLGSGKSSIINTYLAKYPKTKAVRISLPKFHSNDEDLKDSERKLLQKLAEQFFYKINSSKVPQSCYRKIKKKYYGKYFIKTAAVFTVLGCGAAFFSPNNISALNNAVVRAGDYYGLLPAASYLISAGFGLAGMGAAAYAAKCFASALNKGVSWGKRAEEASPGFNKLLDELVYFFESTDYDVVFIEDLEKWNNIGIFAKLRELNCLLNNYELIKRKIVFVYTIRDDSFSVEERTEFFDFIIPVIPFINSTNSGEILRERLKIADGEEKSSIFDISSDYITLISPFLEDMRILNNIYNEFKVYKSILRDLKLRDEVLFSIILFKNLYPREFADLEAERGIVKQAFEDKKRFIVKQNEKQSSEAEKLSSYSLKKLLTEYRSDDIFSSKVKENKLLVFLLKKGFINENYVDYINYFHPKSMTVDEMNFVRTVRMQDSSDFEGNFKQKLPHPKQVCEKLSSYEFGQTEVLNFDLINYLLENERESEKSIELFKGLSDAGEIRFKFIEEYIERNENVDSFINLLCKYFREYWKNIFELNIADDKKFKYLSLILQYGDMEDIIYQNQVICRAGAWDDFDDEEKSCLTAPDRKNNLFTESGIAYFIESRSDSLIKLSQVSSERMVNIIKKLNIKFRKSDVKTVNKEIVDFIFENKYYADNEIMIKNLFDYYLNEGEFKKRLEMIEPDKFNIYMANEIKGLELTLNKEYVERAWDLLNRDGRCNLLSNQIDNYSRREISNKLKGLPLEYHKLSDIDRSHTEILSNDNELYNKKLLYKLNDRKYLSIVEEKGNNIVVLVKKDEQSLYSDI